MKKEDKYYYPAVFSYFEGEEIAVVFPDFDVATSGISDVKALESAKELLGITILSYEEKKEELPIPTQLAELHVESNERAVLIEVYMPSIRMANINKSVNRTVTLPAWLNAKAMEMNINFSQLLQDAIKKQLYYESEGKSGEE